MRKVILILSIAALSGGVFLLHNIYKKNLEQGIAVKTAQENSQFIKTQIKDALPLEQEPVTILFVGDLMFDRYIRQTAERKGNNFIFEKVNGLLKNVDVTVANLEGPITDNPSKCVNTLPGQPGHLVFTFDKNLAKTLFDENIKLVNIGNNHILNFSLAGLEQTKKYLNESDVKYFGDINGQNEYVIENIGGIKIGLVNYNQFEAGSSERVTDNLRKVKNQSAIAVLYAHWGIEYETEASQNTKNLARGFIDNGADLIIGSHSHVVQDKEEYNGKMIYYSLGDFVFDQYWSPETKKGLAVKVTLKPGNEMEFQDIELKLMNNGQTSINEL